MKKIVKDEQRTVKQYIEIRNGVGGSKYLIAVDDNQAHRSYQAINIGFFNSMKSSVRQNWSD